MRQRMGTGPAWVVVAVVAALIAAPVGAVAATSIVKISGPSGKIARVDAANRLLVTDSPSESYFAKGYFSLSTGTCTKLFKNGPARSVLVRQIDFVVKTSPSFNQSHGIVVFSHAECTGASQFIFVPSHIGTEVFTFDPPLPVPANGSLTMAAIGTGVTAEALARGSALPAAAIP